MQQISTVQNSGGIYGFRRARGDTLLEACRGVHNTFRAEVNAHEAVVYRIHERSVKAPVLPIIERADSLIIPGIQDMSVVNAISEAILTIPTITKRVSPVRKSQVKVKDGPNNNLRSMVLIPDDATVDKILKEKQSILTNLGRFATKCKPNLNIEDNTEIDASENIEDIGIVLATFSNQVDDDKIERARARVDTMLDDNRMYLTPCVIFPRIPTN